MKTRLFILLLLLCGATLLQAKTVNKIVFKRSISGPVKLKDSGGGWYTVTNGESFTGEYNFIRGYDGDCNGLSVRHKGEYARPGDNRSDFIRTWYVGESVMPYLNDSYHDCPNAKSSSSSSSSSNNSYSSNRSSSSSSSSNRSSYSNVYDPIMEEVTSDCTLCGRWEGTYSILEPDRYSDGIIEVQYKMIVRIDESGQDHTISVKSYPQDGGSAREWNYTVYEHSENSISAKYFDHSDYDWHGDRKNGKVIHRSAFTWYATATYEGGTLKFAYYLRCDYYDKYGSCIGTHNNPKQTIIMNKF